MTENLNSNNYYEILGVEKSNSQEEIKKAYRILSLKWHPDRNNNSPESTTFFQKISQAYDTLSDEQKRRNYDMGANANANGMGGMGGMGNMGNMGGGMHFRTGNNNDFDPAELFTFFSNNIFANMGPGINIQGGLGETIRANLGKININDMRHRLNKPVPIIKNEEITLAKAFTGCTLPIEIVRTIIENGVNREEKETLYVNIPYGIDNNELLIIKEKGHIHADNNRGDVKIFIKIINNTDLVRNGLDLTLHKIISLKEALCGFTFDMRYIDDRVFKINNGNGNIINHNYKKVIQGMGIKRENHIGNLIIEFSVVFPEKLTEEQVDVLSKIL
jgi:DnaJ family protein B protein 4